MTKIECGCGKTMSGTFAGGNAVTCSCGITYTASVCIATVHQRQRELAEDVARLHERVRSIEIATVENDRSTR